VGALSGEAQRPGRGNWCVAVAVAAFGGGSGLTGGSGRVAVAGDWWLWQCGHFDRRQVDYPFCGSVAVATSGSGCFWGVAVA
jgi:hypothetical protein